MKNVFSLLLIVLCIGFSNAQNDRISPLKNQLDAILVDNPGLNEKAKVNIKETNLGYFLMALSEVHKVNINTAQELNNITIINNFNDVTVADLLLFLCKEYNLTMDITGNIIAIKSYVAPAPIIQEKTIPVSYVATNNLLSVDLKGDQLHDVFKRITDESGKNLVYANGLGNTPITAYIQNMDFDSALHKIAFANDLFLVKDKDGFYLFSKDEDIQYNQAQQQSNKGKRSSKRRKSNFYFDVTNYDTQTLDVEIENTPIADVIHDIGNELGIDIFVTSPLDNAGKTTVKAKNISFDELLTAMFDSSLPASDNTSVPTSKNNNYNRNSTPITDNTPSPTSTSKYSYLKKNNIYFFGTSDQLSVRQTRSITLLHRSIDILGDPSSGEGGRSAGRLNNQNNFTNYNDSGAQNFNNSNSSLGSNSGSINSRNTIGNSSGYRQSQSSGTSSGSILDLVPSEITQGLDIKTDAELNTFIVNGPSSSIDKFESFIAYLDKPIPVVLIEVMLLEINKSATTEVGLSAGIGDEVTKTKGTVFSGLDMSLSSSSVNNIINRNNGFGSLNIGQVIPEFYVKIKAMEENGDLKIRSSPRLSTLNGHRAHLSIGETTYYVVTNQNIYGSQNPQTSEIRNYQPIDAELAVSIKPLVSGDGQITMDIKVIQSSFGVRTDPDAPPGINSREFTSIIRVQDQDIIVLGGLEEKSKNDSGTGVPLLSRIPIIKWFFSTRKRTDARKKLTVLIKPTVIY